MLVIYKVFNEFVIVYWNLYIKRSKLYVNRLRMDCRCDCNGTEPLVPKSLKILNEDY